MHCDSGLSNARHKRDGTGRLALCRSARPRIWGMQERVLAPSTSPNRRRRHKGEVESPAL